MMLCLSMCVCAYAVIKCHDLLFQQQSILYTTHLVFESACQLQVRDRIYSLRTILVIPKTQTALTMYVDIFSRKNKQDKFIYYLRLH